MFEEDAVEQFKNIRCWSVLKESASMKQIVCMSVLVYK